MASVLGFCVAPGKIHADLKRYLKKHTARHPLIVPVILEI